MSLAAELAASRLPPEARQLSHIVPLMAGTQARQEVIADRTAAGRELVKVDGRAEELDRVAHPDGVLGQVGDVDDGQVHRDAPDQRRPAPGNGDFGARPGIGRAGAARQAVGIADQQGREPGRALGGPLSVVYTAYASFDRAYLLDGR